ncbi:sodium transporter HKT1-like protein [Tanacetum coccineum]
MTQYSKCYNLKTMKVFSNISKKLEQLCSCSCLCRFTWFRLRGNQFALELFYFLLISSIGFFVLQSLDGRTTTFTPRSLDLFFTSVSAATVSSMSTVEMEVFSNDQLVILTILMFIGGEVFTSMVALYIRKFFLKVSPKEGNKVDPSMSYLKPHSNFMNKTELAILECGSNAKSEVFSCETVSTTDVNMEDLKFKSFKFLGLVSTWVSSTSTVPTFIPSNNYRVRFYHGPVYLIFLNGMEFRYLPPYTSFLPVAEESCEQGSKRGSKGIESLKFSQLSYLVIFIILVCITERKQMVQDPLNFNVLSIVVEVISAYGNVGFSTGYSCDRRLRQDANCENKWYGFSGKWSDEGKLILIVLTARKWNSSYTVECTWSGAMMLIKLQGGILKRTSWMPHRLMMVDIARGSRLGAQLEHAVSSSYKANPGEFSVPFLILSILILYA